jgi:hypothetical protein
MAQEDKGLVIRGLLLLTFVGALVTIVLGFMFWRTQAQPPIADDGPASAPGWEIRYNAATTLARRGSAKVPWDLLHEMLDEKQQMRNYRVKQPDGQYVHDEAAARLNMISALRAITAWHEKQSDKKQEVPAELRGIYAAVGELTKSPFVELKTQAEKAQATFFR